MLALDTCLGTKRKLALYPDWNYRNCEYDPQADTYDWDNYIQHAHNPRYVRVSRFTTSIDLVNVASQKFKS
jgi:hypothetical protein